MRRQDNEMESAKLTVKNRSDRGTAASRRLRREGLIPVNLYGLAREPRAMVANQHEVEQVVERGFRIVELNHEEKSQAVLIKDVQFDSLGSSILHCDFMRIDRDTPVQVFVPIRFVGTAPEVSGSIVEKIREDVQVETLPLQIPKEFVINLSKLQVGETVTCGDLELPKGCTLHDHNDTDVIVVNHLTHATEEVVEPEEGEEDVEPEVISKGKDDDESEG